MKVVRKKAMTIEWICIIWIDLDSESFACLENTCKDKRFEKDGVICL
jgi:hypothetical protein